MRRDHKSHMRSSHRSVFTFVPNFRGFSLTPNLSKEQRIEKEEEEQARYKQKENAVPTIFFSHRPSKKPRLPCEHHRQEQSQKEVLLCKS